VSRAIEAIRPSWLRRVALFDVYEGAQVGPGRKSLAYGLLYQAEDRTLTDAEVNRAHGELVERLRAELGVDVRGADGAGDGNGGAVGSPQAEGRPPPDPGPDAPHR
jgi:Ferredoxin-fold anticodon binding domain